MRSFCALPVLLAFLLCTLPQSVRAEIGEEGARAIRRAEAAMVLLRHSNRSIKDVDLEKNTYADVVTGEWYTPHVLKAIEIGMFTPKSRTGLVYPHRPVTRSEFLKMITVAFNLPTNRNYTFVDIPDDAWYRSYIGIAHEYDFFPATKYTNQLIPLKRVTYDEAAQAVLLALEANPSFIETPGFFPVMPKREDIVGIHSYAEEEQSSLMKKEKISTPAFVKAALLRLVRRQAKTANLSKSDVISYVNAERVQRGLPPLKQNSYLELAAQNHAKDMYDRGYFSHFTPEGVSYVERIQATGYIQGEPTYSLGENIARGQLDSKQVVNDWMDSPSHRENILREEFEEIGIGIFGDVWVQEFGRLKYE